MFRSWKLGERKVRRARAAPRGNAKSTLVSLIKPIHDVCYGFEKYILILSNTKPQAASRLRNIRNELLTNPPLADDYGIFFARSVPAETAFVINAHAGRAKMEAYGAGAEIRGLTFGPYRPTKIICDDVEHSEEVFNEEIRSSYSDWFKEVVSKLGDETTNMEFVGTVLHNKSLLAALLVNPAYDSKLYKSVIKWSENEAQWREWEKLYSNLDDERRFENADAFYKANESALLLGTKVLWPEKEPYVDLMKEKIEIGRRAFMKEKQNSPQGAEDKVFYEVKYFEERQDGIVIEQSNVFIPWADLTAYGVMDPSTGQEKAKRGKLGDWTCMLAGFKDSKGRLLVFEDWTRREPPAKYINEIFEMHSTYNFEKFGVETNLYRNLLLPNIIAERSRREQETGAKIKLPFYDIENIDNKHKRIYTLEPKITHGWILFSRSLSQEFMGQLLEFPHADHDDCPDALEMLWGLVNNRFKPSPLSIDPTGARG